MQKTIIVLGMHRSGTSCLAGILERAGINLGDVSTKNPHNLKGNRENNEIITLHNDLLKSNNGTWDNPPKSIYWPKHLKKKRDRIIDGFSNNTLWGFKDPRTLLTLDGWSQVLPNRYLIGTFRHPKLVVDSLQRRNKNFTAEKGLFLWQLYNKKLLYYQKKYNFPIISFDLIEREYKNKVQSIVSIINPNLNLSGIEFFEPSLRHHETVSFSSLPRKIHYTYKKLCKVAL